MADKTIPELTDGGAATSGDVVHAYRAPNSRRVTLGDAAGKSVGSGAGDVAAGNTSPAAILTTRGDLLRRGASAPERLALGTQYQSLIAGADDPAWGAVDLGQAAAVTGVLPAAHVDTNLARLNTEDQTLSGGARVTVKDLGNLSGNTITPDPGDRAIQKITNNGAGTIAPGSNHGAYLIVLVNSSGAGAVTTSGFTSVAGDDLTTTNGHKFLGHVVVTADFSSLIWKAMQ